MRWIWSKLRIYIVQQFVNQLFDLKTGLIQDWDKIKTSQANFRFEVGGNNWTDKWTDRFVCHFAELGLIIWTIQCHKIVAAFRGMHVSPAKHSYAWLPRKRDYWTDTRTDRQTPDKVIPMCCYASQATQKHEASIFALQKIPVLSKACKIATFPDFPWTCSTPSARSFSTSFPRLKTVGHCCQDDPNWTATCPSTAV